MDHRYIQIKISLPQECSLSERPRSHFPRWVFGRFNKKLAKEAALAQKWVMPRYSHGAGVEMLEGRIHNALSEVCNAAMSKKWRPLPGIRVAEPQLVKVLGESRAWKNILARIDRDPWGRTFKAARKKLCAAGAPLTDSGSGLPPLGGGPAVPGGKRRLSDLDDVHHHPKWPPLTEAVP